MEVISVIGQQQVVYLPETIELVRIIVGTFFNSYDNWCSATQCVCVCVVDIVNVFVALDEKARGGCQHDCRTPTPISPRERSCLCLECVEKLPLLRVWKTPFAWSVWKTPCALSVWNIPVA